MTLTADSREHDPDNEVESTIIGPDRSFGLPPGTVDPVVTGPAMTEPEGAEAHTIIVSRAEPRHVERAPGKAAVPSAVPLLDPEPAKVLFAIRIGTHPPIPLEVPAYIGRRPSTPRIVGPRMPRLVMVPSPSREVSSTHVEILQAADTVVVTDLGSTNGTTVTSAGSPSRTLRQGESLVVGAETVVDIGDGIRIVIVTLPDVATTEGAL